MARSSRLRLRDLKNVYRLIGECRDLGADAVAWRTHMLRELARLVGAQVSVGGEMQGQWTGQPRMVPPIDLGWAGEAERQNWINYMQQGGPSIDPIFAELERRIQPPGLGLTTHLRRQLLDDREWYGSEYFNEQRRPSRADDTIMSIDTSLPPLAQSPRNRRFAPGSEVLHIICFFRDVNEKQFGRRERNLVHWFHHELAPLVGYQLTSAAEPSPSDLAPRVRQTLECLLEGDSEKQVAARLNLSQPTVHQYVTTIYRHFGVSARAELMARWIRFSRGR